MKSSFLLSALMVVLVSSVSLAQDTVFSTVDKNSDGKVTTSEFKSYAETRLRDFAEMDAFVKKVDADGNGEISQAEFDNRSQVFQAMSSGEMQAKPAETKPHVVGDKASDFELQSLGKKIKLSDNFAKEGHPVVVVFSRANW